MVSEYHMGEWIRVDTALPEEEGLYLVFHYYTDFHYYTPSFHIVLWDGKSWDKSLNITHWMPLPDYPADWASVAFGDGRLIEIPELDRKQDDHREGGMVSEKQGNDSDPVEIEQYTEIFLLTQIRITLIKIHGEVRAISRVLVIAGIILGTVWIGVLLGTFLVNLFY